MADYFNQEDKVRTYIRNTKGYDGQRLIARLKTYLPPLSSLLELGMGPGTDLSLLSESFRVTGSDSSAIFLNLYRNSHPNADLIQLDARTIATTRHFDAIYSNKVLQHLNFEEMRGSFEKQHARLNEGGIALHSFWYGNGSENFDGLWFYYLKEKDLQSLCSGLFDIIEMNRYTELDYEDDSIYAIFRKVGCSPRLQ